MFYSAVFLKTSSLGSNLSDSSEGLILVGKGGAGIYKHFCKKDQKVGTSKEKVSLSRVWLFETPWTVSCQAPLSIIFPQQEYWSRLSFLLQGIFPTQGLNSSLLHCIHILYCLSHQGKSVHQQITAENKQTNKQTNKQKNPRDLKLMNLAFFYVWENVRLWGHWNHSFDMHLSYLGPVWFPACIPLVHLGMTAVAW